MSRVNSSIAKTEAEVMLECPAWSHGCTCHNCRILNGSPEPRKQKPEAVEVPKTD